MYILTVSQEFLHIYYKFIFIHPDMCMEHDVRNHFVHVHHS